jgi:hypothetical protein
MIIVDRIEGKFAICESDGRMIDVPLKLIKGKVRDGVVLVEHDGAYAVDEDATKRRTDEIKSETKDIWDS